jgi:putative hydrolase of HD superfamily
MDISKFSGKLERLKEVKRKGWVIRKINDPESVSDHSFMLAMLSYVYGKRMGLDSERCLKMGLIHDICEVFTKDIIYGVRKGDREMSLEEKREKEKRGMERMIRDLPEDIRKEFGGLFGEFEQGRTKEARLVKDLDKLEMCMQAREYAKKGNKGLDCFFEDGDRNIKHPEIRKEFSRIQKEYIKMKGQ